MHPDLCGISFKKGTKAIVFKFDYNTDFQPSQHEEMRVVMGYSELDMVSGGKFRSRFRYDGSLTETSVADKIGETIDHYINNRDCGTACEDNWRLGLWLLIPATVVIGDKPIEHWIEIAKADFIEHIEDRVIRSRSKELQQSWTDALHKAVDSYEVKPMTVEEWNSARLALLPECKRPLYVTKELPL